MRVKRLIIAQLILFFGCVLSVSQARAVTTLPDPTATYDGIPIASKHDDFWSYSAQIMTALYDEWQPLYPELSGYDFATGTGGLDLLLYSGINKPNSNQDVGPGAVFDFEDHVRNAGGSSSTFDGWWGQNDQNNDNTTEPQNGPVTVGNLLNYLHAFDADNNTPVFYFDLNQTGTESSLSFVGRVYLYDAGLDGIKGTLDDGGIKHQWAFDNTLQAGDGNFDIGSLVPAPGEVTFTGLSSTTYTVDHNLGSGKPDFVAFAPTMDLSLYNSSYLFVSEFHMTGLNDGFEELFLTGGIIPNENLIPEPASLTLLGLGLLGITAKLRKKKNS